MAATKNAMWEYGDNTKPTIVMVHGFRGTHHGLEGVAKQLPHFHVVIPDLPGFGEGAALKHHSLNDYVAWLNDFIDELQCTSPPILLGHSFGSIIAAHFAAQNNEKISKLILINPIGAPALKGPKAILTQGAILYYFIGRKLPKHAARSWLSSRVFVDTMSRVMTKSRDPAMRRFVKDQHRRYFSRFADTAIVAESFRASVSHDVREVAADIHASTLLVAGEKDDITSLPKQRELATLIPHSELKVVSGVGHLIHYETASEAAQIIQAWLTVAVAKTR